MSIGLDNGPGGGGYFVEVFDILPSAFKTDACVQHQEIDLAEIHFYFDA